MPQRPIDAVKAAALCRDLRNWRKVGVELARQYGRKTPYTGDGVYKAVRKSRAAEAAVSEARSTAGRVGRWEGG